MNETRCDLAILGGGLAGSLIALAFARMRPDLRVVLIEQEARFGGDHIWSFFESDLSEAEQALLAPLIAARWQGYTVRFPAYSRDLATGYASVTSQRLDAVLRSYLPAEALRCGMPVVSATSSRVVLADGSSVSASGVIDARGGAGMPHLRGGWQTFLGQMVKTAHPHGLQRPIVMDASVEQHDGYRFVYVLPFSEDELFIEDTYYADHPRIDRPVLQRRIAGYAASRGWQIERVLYEETGALPVIAGGAFERFWASGDPHLPARAGTRAGLVHPLTSYSLPDAVRFAVHLCSLDNLGAERLGRISHEWVANHWREGRFYRMLTKMLFGASAPHERWRMLARFYRLPEPLIERFYAGRSTPADKARVLAGKPPVPVLRALAALAGRGRPLADLWVAGDTGAAGGQT